MADYPSKLTRTAASVLDGEQFVAAMKCYPHGYLRRRITESIGDNWAAYRLSKERSPAHALDEEPLPMEIAVGLTATRVFVFGLSVTSTRAKLPPVKVVPREIVVAVASEPGRAWHVHQTVLWVSLRDGRVLALETAQRHKANGEHFVAQLLETAHLMDVPTEQAAG